MLKNTFTIRANANGTITLSDTPVFNKMESGVTKLVFELPDPTGYAYLLCRHDRQNYYAIPILSNQILMGCTVTQFDGRWAFNVCITHTELSSFPERVDTEVYMSDTFEGLVYDNVASNTTPASIEPGTLQLANDLRWWVDYIASKAEMVDKRMDEATQLADDSVHKVEYVLKELPFIADAAGQAREKAQQALDTVDEVASGCVQKSGDTMTGPLQVPKLYVNGGIRSDGSLELDGSKGTLSASGRRVEISSINEVDVTAPDIKINGSHAIKMNRPPEVGGVPMALVTAIPTKLSQMNSDTNHQTVTQEEKDRWNDGGFALFQDRPIGSENGHYVIDFADDDFNRSAYMHSNKVGGPGWNDDGTPDAEAYVQLTQDNHVHIKGEEVEVYGTFTVNGDEMATMGDVQAIENDLGKKAEQTEVDAIYENGYASRNLANIEVESNTTKGVTFNIKDGVITLSGTATERIDWGFVYLNLENNKNYKVCGKPKNAPAGAKLRITNTTTWSPNIYDDGNGVIYNTGAYGSTTMVGFIIESGTNCNGLVFKIMVTEDLNLTYDDFTPYMPSNVGLGNAISDRYYSNHTYGLGDIVIYDDALWKCKVASARSVRPAEGTTWTKTSVGNEVSAIKNGVRANHYFQHSDNISNPNNTNTKDISYTFEPGTYIFVAGGAFYENSNTYGKGYRTLSITSCSASADDMADGNRDRSTRVPACTDGNTVLQVVLFAASTERIKVNVTSHQTSGTSMNVSSSLGYMKIQ